LGPYARANHTVAGSQRRDDQDEGSSQSLQPPRKKNIKTKGQTDTKTEVQARQIIQEVLKSFQDAEEQRNAFENQLEEKEAQRKAIMRDLSLIQSQRKSQYNPLKLDLWAESPSLRCGTVEDLEKLDVEQEQHTAELHRLRGEMSTVEANIVYVKEKVKDIVSGTWSKMRTHLGKHGDRPWGVLERLKKDCADDDMEVVVRLINTVCLEK
jgi:seryl-tRNA synthetase